jgi:hypothetical protein
MIFNHSSRVYRRSDVRVSSRLAGGRDHRSISQPQRQFLCGISAAMMTKLGSRTYDASLKMVNKGVFRCWGA